MEQEETPQSGAKNLIPYVAVGAAVGAAEAHMLAGAGIRKGPWELWAPLVIFMCVVACVLAWGSAAIAYEDNLPYEKCIERVLDPGLCR